MSTRAEDLQLGSYKYGWHDESRSVFEPKKGLSAEVVEEISDLKSEPKWMRDLRLKSFKQFQARPMPNWGSDLSGIDFDDIYYFVRSTEKQANTWEDLPEEIKNTYDRLGIPEAEKQRLVAGVAAQYECLAQDTRVWTVDRGLVPIKEIAPGDRVFALDEPTGEFIVAPVKGGAQTGVRQTYAVTVNGQAIKATDNHPMLVLEDQRKPGRERARYARRWKTVGELNIGDLVAVPRGLPAFGASHSLPAMKDPHGRSRAVVPATSTVDLMWLLGYYLGDGSLQSSGRTHRVQFAVPETDAELRKEITEIVRDLFGLEAIAADDQRLVVNSKALVEWFQDLGFMGTSLTKRVPQWVFTLPLDERLAFLGGWVDADGYVRPEEWGSVLLTSANAPLLEQASDLAVLAGLRSAGPWEFSGPHPHDPERTMIGYRLGISGDFEQLDCRNPKRFMRFGRRQYHHSNTSANGTTFRAHCTDHLGFARVTAIVEADVEPVYDIEVDGPHNFIAEGMVVHNSEVVYHKIREDLEAEGVIFMDTDSALREHEDLFREHFGKVIPPNDNKLSALNTAVWSGGSFIWIPEGVKVDIPLQAYFRINKENMGQFERTLIIAEPGSYIHYVEGCLPAGELVGTADGDRQPIETIAVGDEVLDQNGRPVRVTATQARDHRGDLYSFVPLSPDNAFRVTGEHPILVVPRSEVLVKRKPRNGWKAEVDTRKLLAAQPRWVEAKSVEEGDFLVFPKPKPAPAKTVMALGFARLAGYYLADGSASLVNGYKALQFSLHIEDVDSIDEIRRLCKELYDSEGSVFWNEEKHEARVLIYTPAGYDALSSHVGTRSHTKRLSPDLLRQDTTFLENLVETYMRGDGCIRERGGANWCRANTTSRAWAHQLQGILARLGTYATISVDRKAGPGEILGRDVMRYALYRVQWTRDGKGPRQFRDAGDYFLVPLKRRDVEHFEGLVYNLDVRAPDSYLAAGFAVHNCTAPIYSSDSLHSAVVEIIVKPGARVRYTTIQNWSNNVYNLVTKRAAAYEDATMEWIDGNIGCLASGSKVTTPGGIKAIEELTPGEKVLSYDHDAGEFVFRRVLAKKYSGQQQVREVSVGERRIRVTDNHPFFSYTYDPNRGKQLGRYDLAYVRADALTEAIVPTTSIDYGEPHKLEFPDTVTDFVGANQYTAGFASTRERESRLVVDRQTSDDTMWLFGLFLGDGSIERREAGNGGLRWGKVVFSVPRDDRARARLVDVMADVMPGVQPTERADAVTLTWNSVEFVELLERNGLAGNAHTKRLPHWVLSLPETQRLALVAGYLDSDGCAARGRRGLSIKSVNRSLLQDVAAVLTSLGITSRLHTEFDTERRVMVVGNEVTARGAHRLEFVADARLVARICPGLRQAVERQEPAQLRHFRKVGRSNIELPDTVEIRKVHVSQPGPVVPTWDIEVEGTGNFVSEGFIVHNSKVTMKYPAVHLMGRGARGEVLSVAFAGDGQHQDAGAKMVHHAPDTSSQIISKSVSQGKGRTSYRGLVEVNEGAHRVKSNVVCDALLLDETARSDTYPYMNIAEEDAQIGHEASVSRIGEEQLFYLQSRGVEEFEAQAMIVRGFIEPISKELPMEYSVELNRLISLNMEGSVG